jgi:hypothetical protein
MLALPCRSVCRSVYISLRYVKGAPPHVILTECSALMVLPERADSTHDEVPMSNRSGASLPLMLAASNGQSLCVSPVRHAAMTAVGV